MANVLNYTEQGGSKTVIGGELVVTGKLTLTEGSEVEGFPVAENQEDSTATSIADLKKDLNDLLSKLKAAGLMAGD